MSLSAKKACGLAAAALLGAAATSASPGTAKVLFFTKSSGYEHDAIKADEQPGHGYAFRVLREFGARERIEFVESKDGSMFTPAYLAQFDAFVFYTSGDLSKARGEPRGDGFPPISPAGKAALLSAVAEGKGFVGIHSAADTYHSFGRNTHVPERFLADGDQADDYIRMLGGEFIRHGAQQRSSLHVVDPAFPGMMALSGEISCCEEWYSLKNFSPNLHVLLAQDPAGMQGPEYRRPPYPSTWARMHRKGRVFYTSMGHRQDVWDSSSFQSVLFGGITWALGRAEADVSPNLTVATPSAHVLPGYEPAPEPVKPPGTRK